MNDPNPNPPTPPAGDPPSDPQKPDLSPGYVQSLKNESIRARKEAEDLAKERDELKAFKDAEEKKALEAKGEYDKALAKIESDRKAEAKKFADEIAARDKRYIVSEAKAAAIKAGIIDPNDIASIDFGDAKIGDDGSVSGLEEKIAALKVAKPHWFKAEGAAAPGGGQNPRPGASPGGAGSGGGEGAAAPGGGQNPRPGASPGGAGSGGGVDPNAIDWRKLSDAQVNEKLLAMGIRP